ncbi:hypothetical protein HPB51_025528 [Rhipicephalus microplus]|uniref:Uncharacterized protein n=1 Tax=Rhipicephalus microplus TaxID=6941 RepID=A0A9J6FAP3_RHIMP|nr:hypothetical protein HPB51_025528 [Rhipicephalus microplus]
MEPGTPALFSYDGARFNDVLELLERLPLTLPRPVLHVGTMDIVDNGCAQAARNLKELVERIHQMRPNLELCISLPLPRAPNRRRRGANKRFVHWFNREASRFVSQVRRLCYRGQLGRSIFYLDHAFHEMPPCRVLAADGLHPSFDGIVILALIFRELLTASTSRWQPQNLQPARNAAPICAGSPAPAANTVSVNSSSPQSSVPPAPRPVTAQLHRRWTTTFNVIAKLHDDPLG